jgi:glucose/arabinose dehydrogenase
MPDSKLYITTGDATKRERAQQLSSLAGKTLRPNNDGTVPADNPFVGQEDARPEIWTYGHRNSQGVGRFGSSAATSFLAAWVALAWSAWCWMAGEW